MEVYESLHLVKGEDLNHHGTLFGARASQWFLEAGFAAAACEHGDPDEIVLRNLSDISFYKPVPKGAVVSFAGRVVRFGRTSIIVSVEGKNRITGELYLDGSIVFVTVDAATGQKKEHGHTLTE